jgi:Fe-S-cluster-containing hydrogenase component 2
MLKEKMLKKTGCPSIQELIQTPGFPRKKDYMKGPIAFIECIEEIPCNPCENACPKGAITVGSPITNLPVLNVDKCAGCGLCIAVCPGLAIYVKDYTYSDDEAVISFPYEYYPLPEEGQEVIMVNRMGEQVCRGTVIKVNNSKRNNKTPIISAVFDKRHFDEVVSIKRIT